MVRRGGAELGCEQRASVGAELVGMHAYAEAERFRSAQYSARVGNMEDVRLAEDVAVFGQTLFRNAGAFRR
jgi:hypothetical protein